MQTALRLGNLTIAVSSDILRPDEDSFLAANEITYPCAVGEVLRHGVCGKGPIIVYRRQSIDLINIYDVFITSLYQDLLNVIIENKNKASTT